MEYSKECLNCGKPFISKTRRAKFCSDYCRVDFNRKKAKEDALPKEWVQVEEVSKPKKVAINENDIRKKIEAIMDEKMPSEIKSWIGKKNWHMEQKKRIAELEKQLK